MSDASAERSGIDLTLRQVCWRVAVIVFKLLPALWLLQSEQSFVYQGF